MGPAQRLCVRSKPVLDHAIVQIRANKHSSIGPTLARTCQSGWPYLMLAMRLSVSCCCYCFIPAWLQASAAAAASSLQGRPVVAAGKPPTQVQKARAVNEQRKSMAAAQAFIQQLAAQATQQGTAVQPSEQHHATGPAPAPAADPASTAVAAAQPAGAASDAPLPSVAGAAASRLADGPPAAAKQAGAGAVLGKQAAQGRAGTSPQAQTPAAKRARLNKPVQARQAGQTGGTAAAGTVLGAAALADAVSLRAASSSPPDAGEWGFKLMWFMIALQALWAFNHWYTSGCISWASCWPLHEGRTSRIPSWRVPYCLHV